MTNRKYEAGIQLSAYHRTAATNEQKSEIGTAHQYRSRPAPGMARVDTGR